MKLYIRQRVFSLTDRYDIYDEFENPYFHVQSEFLTPYPPNCIFTIKPARRSILSSGS